ncbi:MAG: nuclear transport factor 2 family protein [Polyangiales bacterium]
MDVEARLARLEAIEDIKKLKARYWYYCDHKDVENVRACFAPGEVEIHYDGPVGLVHHRDGLYEVFKNVALAHEIVELHHGGPPVIEMRSLDTATGMWSLSYRLMNTEHRTMSIVGGYYRDEYSRIDGEWKISKTRFRVVSAVTFGWKSNEMKMLYFGATLPDAV